LPDADRVRARWMSASPEERPAFPAQVDGIPVVVMFGDYTIETPDVKKE
jgi:hypothetical protein